jgi:hypothetical protein
MYVRVLLTCALVAFTQRAYGLVGTPSTIVQSKTFEAQTILTTTGAFIEATEPIFEADFELFDPALGMLTEVTAEIASQWAIFGTAGSQFGGIYAEIWGGIAWNDLVYEEVLESSDVFVIPFTPFHKAFSVNRTVAGDPADYVGVGTGTLRMPTLIGPRNYIIAPSTTGGSFGLENMTMRLTYSYLPIPEPDSAMALALSSLALRRRRRMPREV